MAQDQSPAPPSPRVCFSPGPAAWTSSRGLNLDANSPHLPELVPIEVRWRKTPTFRCFREGDLDPGTIAREQRGDRHSQGRMRSSVGGSSSRSPRENPEPSAPRALRGAFPPCVVTDLQNSDAA